MICRRLMSVKSVRTYYGRVSLLIPRPCFGKDLAVTEHSAVEHRPADVVPQPLVVKHELANRLRELVTLPPALQPPGALALALRRASACGLDGIGGRTEFVRGDVRDDPGLASSVRGMPCCPTQVSGRGHGMAGRRASLGHLHLATHPGAGMLDRLTRSRVLRPGRLEEVKDVLRARCRPKGQELVIRIGEGPTAANRHEAGVSDLREDHGWHSCCLPPPNTLGGARATRHAPSKPANAMVDPQARRLHGSDRTVTAPRFARHSPGRSGYVLLL